MVESKSNNDSDDVTDEEDEEKTMTQPQRDEMLMKAVKDNDFEAVTEALKIGADP